MLRLYCDVSCGYVDKYMMEKNYFFNLSFLADPEFFANKKINFKLLPEQELYLKYKDNPKQLLSDFNLSSALMGALSSDYGLRYFPEVFDKNKAPIIFPELIQITNLRVVYTEDTLETTDNNAAGFLEDILNIYKTTEETTNVPQVDKKVKNKKKKKQHYDA